MKIKYLKHVCDRCGEFLETEQNVDFSMNEFSYPPHWQTIRLSQTGATLDLCEKCNNELFHFLIEKGGINMDKACFNDRAVI